MKKDISTKDILQSFLYIMLVISSIYVVDIIYPINQPEFSVYHFEGEYGSTTECNFNKYDMKYFVWCKLIQDEDYLNMTLKKVEKYCS